MGVRHNNELALWAKELIGDMSLRQVEIRTGVSYATISSLVQGRNPNADTVIRFARGFQQDVPAALRLAGYEDIAKIWEGEAAAPKPEEPAKTTGPKWIANYRNAPIPQQKKIDRMVEILLGEEEE